MTRLALLWHLHQPDYRHPDTGRPTMPWTRLHALRGYRDLAIEALEQGQRATFNLVPVLIDQLLDLAAGIEDDHLALTRIPAADLDARQREAILGTFVAGNPVMIDTQPGYRPLAARVRAGEPVGVDELRDLQVWSTLAWFGSTAVRDHAPLAALRRKGAGFTEDDKAVLLEVQRSILEEVPVLFRRLARSGHAAVSVSPYTHPILPLLVDVRHAGRCLRGLPDDVDFAWPDDALDQLVRARARAKEVLGVEPVGLWPSEGAVSPEVAVLARQAGFRWLASDDGVLHRSVGHRDRPGSGAWDLGNGLRGFFRDHELSDRIGFVYATWRGEDAARDLLAAVRERGEGVITLALDGENPWESYPDGGAGFRSSLQRLLARGPVRGVTLDEAAEESPVGRVQRLHTGSWIGADLAIWYGSPADWRAWRALAEVRRRVGPNPSEAARAPLRAAEGSDWTWWAGDEFSTPFAEAFDALFRAHLAAACAAAGVEAPDVVHRPILVSLSPRLRPPTGWLGADPASGRAEDWRGAGWLSWPPDGSMGRGDRHTPGLSYGWTRGEQTLLWVRVALARPLPDEPGARWEVRLGDDVVVVGYGGGEGSAGATRVVHAEGGLVACRPASGASTPVAVTLLRADGSRVAWPASGADLLPAAPPATSWWTV